jgi:hypothetical protein
LCDGRHENFAALVNYHSAGLSVQGPALAEAQPRSRLQWLNHPTPGFPVPGAGSYRSGQLYIRMLSGFAVEVEQISGHKATWPTPRPRTRTSAGLAGRATSREKTKRPGSYRSRRTECRSQLLAQHCGVGGFLDRLAVPYDVPCEPKPRFQPARRARQQPSNALWKPKPRFHPVRLARPGA